MSHSVVTLTGLGSVQGRHVGGACRFSAIPYAEAPVGALRWRAPRPAHWTGTLSVIDTPPIAPQWPSRLSEAMGDFDLPQSEDCLHLTVWTPAADRGRRPVLLWLHGGDWQSGASALDW